MKDIGIRAAKTFGQAFAAVIVAAQISTTGDLTYQLFAAAGVAGLAAVASFVNNLFLSSNEE